MRVSLIARCIIVVVLGLAAPASSAAQIWEAPIMRQPFDKEPLREVKIPEWVRNLSLVTYCFSTADDTMRERATKAGATISQLDFAGTTYVAYDSKYLKQHVASVPAGKVEKEIAAYNKLGVKILGAVPPWLIGEIYFAHPEWRRIGTNTTVIPMVDEKTQPYGGQLCMIGPWGDRLIDILAEIVTKYPDVAAFSFDGLHDYGCCYCKSCRDAYRKDTGLEIPTVNMDDPAFRRYQYWVDRRMESFVERMQTRLKGINPNIALITWTTNAGRYGHFLSIPRNMSARMNLLFDAPDQEFWMDETNRGNSVVPAFANAYIWAVTNHRVAFSTTYIMSHGNPYGNDSFPPGELIRRFLLALTYGPQPSFALFGVKPLDEATLIGMQEVKKREPWTVQKSPEPWAAVVMSDNTKTFYGRDPQNVEERYLSNVFGVFRTSIEEHLPVTVINDWNLNSRDLARYKVLVLPNTACMNDEQAKAVRKFVADGGGLVASVDASLYDEMGDRRQDFLLADVLGVHYKGTAVGGGQKEELDPNFAKTVDAGYWERHKSIFDFKTGKHPIFDSQKLRDYLPQDSVCFKGQAVTVSVTPEAQAIGTMISRDLGSSSVPSVVVHNYGKGKVVYLAAGMDSAYYLYPYPYQRVILAQAMRWAAPEQPKILVEAPMCVHSTFYRQSRNGERLTVQLFNDFNSTACHAKPDEDVPLTEEVVPIHDIKLTFRGYSIKRVHLEPEGIELKSVRVKDGVQVTVPKLLTHSIVVAELK